MYITWTGVGLAALFACMAALCVYLIILIRNLNASIGVLKRVLTKNEENINQVIKDLPVVTRNLSEISESAKNDLKNVEAALDSINETIGMAAATANTFKSDFLGIIKIGIDLFDMARKIIQHLQKR